MKFCVVLGMCHQHADPFFLSGCCARAESGRVAAPPSSEMNSRRLMFNVRYLGSVLPVRG
jgi:hypothetical protein